MPVTNSGHFIQYVVQNGIKYGAIIYFNYLDLALEYMCSCV